MRCSSNTTVGVIWLANLADTMESAIPHAQARNATTRECGISCVLVHKPEMKRFCCKIPSVDFQRLSKLCREAAERASQLPRGWLSLI